MTPIEIKTRQLLVGLADAEAALTPDAPRLLSWPEVADLAGIEHSEAERLVDGMIAADLLRGQSGRDGAGRIFSVVVAGVTAHGHQLAETFAQQRDDRTARRRTCRSAFVRWLHEEDALSLAAGANTMSFLTFPEAKHLGSHITAQELDQAASWLHSRGLVGGTMVNEADGPVRAFLTPEGLRCAEDFNGDVADFERAQRQPAVTPPGHTFNVRTDGPVQIATGENSQQTMSWTEARDR